MNYQPTAWAYADIVKVEEDKDGSVRVYGRPTHEVLDVDHQIADKEWANQALPEWYQTGANIREMHQPKAIGKGEKLEFDENDDPWLTARIIDPNAVKLVKEGVLQGFSIGIKDPIVKRDSEAPNGRIVGGKIVEISAVDRPAVPTAKVELVKMTGPDEYLDVQHGMFLTKNNPTDGTQLNPADFDAEGNPIDQPGHLKTSPEQPQIIAQDTHSVTVKVGDKVYTVPVDMDGQGNVVVGEPYEVPGIEPAEGTPGNPEVDLADGEKGVSITEKAVWSTEFQDNLPDSSFAYISPGGKKVDGKTEPRSLRHLPYKDADGKPDAAHVRDALARLDQTDIPADAKAEAKRKLDEAAKEVGIDVEGKQVTPDLQKAAMTAAQSQKVLCQTCHKHVGITKTLNATMLDGGARVEAIGDCGHTVRKFVKSAEMDSEEDKAARAEHDDDCQCDDCKAKREDKAEQKAEGGDESDKPDEDPETAEEDKELEKFARMFDKWASARGLFKDANPDDMQEAEDTQKRKIEDLRDAHKALGDKIEEYAAKDLVDSMDTNKAADPNGGPSRVRFNDPKETIKELKAHLKRMQDLIDDGEDEMEHEKGEGGDGHLAEDNAPDNKKPKGDGRINFTAGDMKGVVADAVKAALARQPQAPSADLAKAVGMAVKDAVTPLMDAIQDSNKRLAKVEHMAQPSPFLIAAEKQYAMNPQQDERDMVLKKAKEVVGKMSPQQQVDNLANMIAEGRGWQHQNQ